eukprot:gene6388-7493_t
MHTTRIVTRQWLSAGGSCFQIVRTNSYSSTPSNLDTKTLTSFINGQFRDPIEPITSSYTFLNPTTQSPLLQYSIPSQSCIEEAIEGTQRAAEILGKMTGADHATLLRDLAKAVSENASHLAILEASNTGTITSTTHLPPWL